MYFNITNLFIELPPPPSFPYPRPHNYRIALLETPFSGRRIIAHGTIFTQSQPMFRSAHDVDPYIAFASVSFAGLDAANHARYTRIHPLLIMPLLPTPFHYGVSKLSSSRATKKSRGSAQTCKQYTVRQRFAVSIVRTRSRGIKRAASITRNCKCYQVLTKGWLFYTLAIILTRMSQEIESVRRFV